MNKRYLLGHDLMEKDSLMDGFTFEEVINTLNCNEEVINEKTARKIVNEILTIQLTDMNKLLNDNIQEIIKRAEARRQYGKN